jgi:hypothetical protein
MQQQQQVTIEVHRDKRSSSSRDGLCSLRMDHSMCTWLFAFNRYVVVDSWMHSMCTLLFARNRYFVLWFGLLRFKAGHASSPWLICRFQALLTAAAGAVVQFAHGCKAFARGCLLATDTLL